MTSGTGNQQPVLFPPHFSELSLTCTSSQHHPRCSERRTQTLRLHLRGHKEYCRCQPHSIRNHLSRGDSRTQHYRPDPKWVKHRKASYRQFPKNVILSGVSLIGATETKPGSILHDDHDHLIIGPFINPNISHDVQLAATQKFVEICNASGKVDCELNENVGFVRWRKLLYNAGYNSACTIT